ncbi:hypothetical protein QJS10_CPB17g00566 [Acorus calamus]|uniref:Uncharacterized protein n=1 Tax=Acorus calamus TaxID=4465 RepID=A0AAV9CQR9_ACOCL|nr:hypothetical protein QJS10_CPB17g00566 [Acorus calamus]
MRQVMQFFERVVELPHLSPNYMNVDPQELEQYQGFDVPFMSLHSSKIGFLQTSENPPDSITPSAVSPQFK